MPATRFTETMTGFVALDASDPGKGFESGRHSGDACTFNLTIEVEDVRRHLREDDMWAVALGSVDCDLFGGRCIVDAGRFRLFDPVSDPARRAMRYRLPFVDGAGNPVELVGRKDVGDDPGFDVWSDTTRLSVEIRAGHDTGELEETGAPVLARGIVVITPMALARQMTTFRGPPREVLRFLRAFASTLWRLYRK